MADRYRLPEALGGGEVRGREVRTGVSVGVGSFPVVLAEVDSIGEITVPLSAMTKVEPPLPPEPPDRAVVYICDPEGGPGILAERNDDSAPSPDTGRRWWAGGLWYGWPWLCNRPVAPVRLVPDPAAGVELPWRGGHPQAPFTVSFGDQGGAAIVSSPGPFILAAVDARAMAAALLAAADAAEAVTP
jgi:hypothetical protein